MLFTSVPAMNALGPVDDLPPETRAEIFKLVVTKPERIEFLSGLEKLAVSKSWFNESFELFYANNDFYLLLNLESPCIESHFNLLEAILVDYSASRPLKVRSLKVFTLGSVMAVELGKEAIIVRWAQIIAQIKKKVVCTDTGALQWQFAYDPFMFHGEWEPSEDGEDGPSMVNPFNIFHACDSCLTQWESGDHGWLAMSANYEDAMNEVMLEHLQVLVDLEDAGEIEGTVGRLMAWANEFY